MHIKPKRNRTDTFFIAIDLGDIMEVSKSIFKRSIYLLLF
ncbi:hypothetical protein LEP1GSC185_0593 [Leptospira licerasiae serovar Varillal str. VAR 010]|nr:hypothetical protein LEP1GSC185_0593 [Leptospira licerasiae serovar Varillal str. VAR 010]